MMSNNVLLIPELLELILLEVDQRTILNSCVRVCKYWNNAIFGSPRTREYLYLHAHYPDHLIEHADPFHYPVNPLLEYGFPKWFARQKDGLSPVLTVTNGTQNYTWDEGNDYISLQEAFCALPWYKNPEAWRRKEASWRKMEITQPPVRRLYIDNTAEEEDEDSMYYGLVDFPQDKNDGKGLTMGELYDYIEKVLLRRSVYLHNAEHPGNVGDKNFIDSFRIGVSLWNGSDACYVELSFYEHYHGWVEIEEGMLPKFESEAYEGVLDPEWKPHTGA